MDMASSRHAKADREERPADGLTNELLHTKKKKKQQTLRYRCLEVFIKSQTYKSAGSVVLHCDWMTLPLLPSSSLMKALTTALPLSPTSVWRKDERLLASSPMSRGRRHVFSEDALNCLRGTGRRGGVCVCVCVCVFDSLFSSVCAYEVEEEEGEVGG